MRGLCLGRADMCQQIELAATGACEASLQCLLRMLVRRCLLVRILDHLLGHVLVVARIDLALWIVVDGNLPCKRGIVLDWCHLADRMLNLVVSVRVNHFLYTRLIAVAYA